MKYAIYNWDDEEEVFEVLKEIGIDLKSRMAKKISEGGDFIMKAIRKYYWDGDIWDTAKECHKAGFNIMVINNGTLPPVLYIGTKKFNHIDELSTE